jgi:hypothetical protein
MRFQKTTDHDQKRLDALREKCNGILAGLPQKPGLAYRISVYLPEAKITATGDTYHYRDSLRSAGMRFASLGGWHINVSE